MSTPNIKAGRVILGLTPSPTRRDFHVGGVSGLGMKPRIGQDNHLLVKLRNQRVKMRVVDIRRGAVPGADQAPLVQDNTELPPTIHR